MPNYIIGAAVRLNASNWSEDVKTKWHPPEGFFEQSAEKIAHGLKSASTDKAQASSRLSFYRNRAGKNLSSEDKSRLENAQTKLHSLYDDEN